jgi:acetyl esterase
MALPPQAQLASLPGVLVHGRTTIREAVGERAASVRDRLSYRGARLLMALPPRLQLRLAGGAAIEVDGQTLLPEMQLLLALRDRMGALPMSALSPESARRAARREGLAFAGPPTAVGEVRDLEIPAPHGTLAARHYAPAEPGGPHPLLVYLHGGGFVIGDLDVYDEPCRLLCRHAGVHVLSVEYRLAPEHPFPAAVDDAAVALEWAQAHAGELGADPEHVAIGGDSAGGNLAAVAAREAAVRPCAQLLIYPAADPRTEHRSLELFAEGFFLTRADRDWYHGHYTGPDPSDDPRCAPIAGDLAALPPTQLVTAAFDPLRDEGEAYADALRAAGVPVLARRVPGQVHGFLNMTGLSPAARAAVVEIGGTLRALARGVPPREETRT